ncbi:MAG: hypothetical protein U0V56_11085 [Actinomycetota bacterium]
MAHRMNGGSGGSMEVARALARADEPSDGGRRWPLVIVAAMLLLAIGAVRAVPASAARDDQATTRLDDEDARLAEDDPGDGGGDGGGDGDDGGDGGEGGHPGTGTDATGPSGDTGTHGGTITDGTGATGPTGNTGTLTDGAGQTGPTGNTRTATDGRA